MKKLIFLSTLAAILIVALTRNASAQASNELAFNNTSFTEDKLLVSNDKKTFQTEVTNVNFNAVRHFSRFYKNVANIRWFRTEKGYVANFISPTGIDTRITYDEKGKWLYDMLIYTEYKMPSDLHNLVKSRYDNYDIVVTCQYNLEDKTVYIVRVSDEHSNIKILRVYDGEIEELPADTIN